MSLLKKLQEQQAKSTFKARPEETQQARVISIHPLKDTSRVLVKTDKLGDLFVYKSAFNKGVPTSGGFDATLVLQENLGKDDKEYINVKSIDYSYDDLSARDFVATTGSVVAL